MSKREKNLVFIYFASWRKDYDALIYIVFYLFWYLHIELMYQKHKNWNITKEKKIRKVGRGKWHPEKTKKGFFKSYINCEVSCICAYAFSKSTVTLKKSDSFESRAYQND